ncbi:MAG: hypothetical protein IIX44_06830 [Clostridia bacterium]|nr:hypothetical protein [Clostridia bacterium]
MVEFFVIAIILAIVSTVLYFKLFLPWQRDLKVSNSINNRDTYSRTYLFKISTSKEEFLKQLEYHKSNADITSSFDPERMVITFSDGAEIQYFVNIKVEKNHCIVIFKQCNLIHGRSCVPMHINRFMIEQFGAELVPYDEKYEK